MTRPAVDLDLDVVIELVRGVARAVEADIARDRLPGGDQPARVLLEIGGGAAGAEPASAFPDRFSWGYQVVGRLDYNNAFGPVILGHAHPAVEQRVHETLQQIDILGLGVTELEIALAERD